MTVKTTTRGQTPRIQTLARADAILSVVQSSDKDSVQLSELSALLELNKTTVFNLAESLVALGYLSRTKNPKGYRLGLRNLELGRAVSNRLPVLEFSRHALQNLCQHTGETVNLAVPYLQEAIIIEALQSRHAVRATAYSGARSAYHSSACGKAIFAYKTPEFRQWIYDSVGLKAATPQTITDPDVLEAELAEVLVRGYATDKEENELGAYCIAMPIFGPFDEAVASISVSGLIQRMTPELIDDVERLLKQETSDISRRLQER